MRRVRLLAIASVSLLVIASGVVLAAAISGTNDSDTKIGTDESDTINGSASGDGIAGKGGDDQLYGDSGGDAIVGGDLSGVGSGNDKLFGGKGKDFVSGEDGDDYIMVADDEGGDEIECGAGTDLVIFDQFSDPADDPTALFRDFSNSADCERGWFIPEDSEGNASPTAAARTSESEEGMQAPVPGTPSPRQE